MTAAPSETIELLGRWHAGDKEALASLLARDLPWIRSFVRRRLGPLLKKRAETVDYVQEAMLQALRYGPRFVVSDQRQFRVLLGRIIENMLRDQVEWHGARKRGAGREEALPSASCLYLDAPSRTRPSEAAAREEGTAWVQLALELLDPDDRKVILLREWQGKSFAEIGAELGVQENTARMRFQRALPKLADVVIRLRAGRVAEALGETADED